MTLQSLLDSLEYSLIQGSIQTEISHLTEDSRTVRKGSLFFCRRGYQTDGEQYLAEALAKGAAAVICQSAGSEMLELLFSRDISVAVVGNMDEAMQTAAANFYDHPQKKLTLIGITGTKGKTTVSMMLRALLECAGLKTILIGTNGIFTGDQSFLPTHTTPPLLQLYQYLDQAVRSGCSHAVMEVSSLAVKQGRIRGLDFSLGVFTNFSPDHILAGEHESLEEYRSWKRQFLEQCPFCVLNVDDPWGEELSRQLTCPMLTCSRKRKADLYAVQAECRMEDSFWGSVVEVMGCYEGVFRLSMPGSYNVSNALTAAAAGFWAGVSFEQIWETMQRIQVTGRCQVAARYHGAWLVIDYAHNESSLLAVLNMVREYHPHRIVCLFGCGGERSKLRRFGMGRISARLADVTVITQDNSRREPFSSILADIMDGIRMERGEYLIIPDRTEAIRHCIRLARPGDFILFLGKGHETYQEINGSRQHFSDLETICREIENETKEKGEQ
ncbi:MAG: UDP-N-acetylmuramoyl-L-alanyl-D-glutamate--2,6-diaminopimelate ligase [Lachnospiraceae bacterium]|nr:UDP-N-acetylmuramoyl-L-alanyl-D-glutamate--2,6-diaminopimelate ligase [Lachnospiraceae bacterium]